MRIKLRLNNRIEEIKKELMKRDIEITEDADLILTEDYYSIGKVLCENKGEKYFIDLEDIIFIESIGKEILVHTMKSTYNINSRIYKLEASLPNDLFIRISNSIIIKKDSIKSIKPSFTSKFYLTLKNDALVDVTRTYYYKFKEFYGI